MASHGSTEWVCDHWALQTRDDARTKRSGRTRWGGYAQHTVRVFQEGRRLYSYGHHYLLAQLVEHEGRTLALINDRKYSVSTSNHQRFAWQSANRAGHTIVEIDGACFPGAADVAECLSKARETVEKATRRRVGDYAAFDLENAGVSIAKARELATLANLPFDPQIAFPPALEPLLASLQGKAVRDMISHGSTRLRDALTEFASCKPSTLKG